VIYYLSTTRRFFVFICVFFVINTELFAQNTIHLSSQQTVSLSTNDIFIFEDSTNLITSINVISSGLDSLFRKVPNNKFYSEKLNTNYWLRFRLKNTSDSKDWLFEFPDPHISEIHFFRPNEAGIMDSVKTVGFSYPFYNKEYKHKNYIFKVYLPKDSLRTFYVLLNTENYAGFTCYVREEKSFTNYALTEYILLGFYYGVLIIMAIYNLFLYFNTKDRVYIYYVVYALCCALNSFSEDGLGFQYIWPNYPILNQFVSFFTPALLLTAFVFYSFSFLNLKDKANGYSKIIIIIYFLYLLVFLTERLVFNSQRIYQFIFVIPFLLIYLASFKIYLNGEKSARFFILAYTMIIISFVIYLFRVFDLIPNGFGLFAVYSFNLGFLIEVLILSIALGDRIRIERNLSDIFQQQVLEQLIENESLKNKLISELKEKELIQEEVNKELESKVSVRTKDLQNKTDELSVFNSNLSKLVEDLNQMNIKLDIDNWQLKQKVQEEVKARLSDEELSTEKFKELFPDDASCMRYLENIKWSNGFICKKCGHDRYIIHTSPFSRKCTSCKHVESVTADTLFHGIRIPMDKAFYIVYDTIRSGKSKTLEELSELLGLNKNTVWAFRKKIQTTYELLKTKSKGALVRWDDLLSN
jgi:hypothetical protein